ncbi:MAG: hypothetical protein ABSC94_01465 [Polyangiaceae bacterium]
MRVSPKAENDRTGRLGMVALTATGIALLAAAAFGTYQGSLGTARAVRELAPVKGPRVLLPGSSIETLHEPLMAARRAALRDGFDKADAPVEAYDELRTIPGHDAEARDLLAEFWQRKAMLTDDPVRRVLYALQSRVVHDDERSLRSAQSAIAALGPLEQARHVAEGTILWADPRTLVVGGAGWTRVLNEEAGTSFDLAGVDARSALADGRRVVAWDDDTARIWDLDGGGSVPVDSVKLLSGEDPLSLSGDCVLTSEGRVWRSRHGLRSVDHGRRPWLAGAINTACDGLVLLGDGVAAYRRRAGAWMAESTRTVGRRGPTGKSDKPSAGACAEHATRCVLGDATGAASVWDFSSSARRLLAGLECRAPRFSPNGTGFICRESEGRVVFYREHDEGDWTRSDLVLPPLTGLFLEDDATLCGSIRPKDPSATDHSDVFFLAAQPCWAPSVVERSWGTIRMLPAGNGAVFTFPPHQPSPSAGAEFFGFDSRGESLAEASNAFFGERKDERLLEYDATNSAGQKNYELGGTPFDPALALGDAMHVSSVRIDDAFFVEAPRPSLVLEVGYGAVSSSEPSAPHRAVARWDLRGKHFCGPALPGGMDAIAPTGDAVVIEGRIYRIGVCTSDHGFDPTDITGAVAVGPGAQLWMSRDGESLMLGGARREPAVIPHAEKESMPQVAFSPNGDRFLVRTTRSLCKWMIHDDASLDLDGCRWSTAGWASDAAWAASDKTGETVVVFDRTAEGAALWEFFGSDRTEVPSDVHGDVACNALPGPGDAPLGVLQDWEDRLGHRFKDQRVRRQDTGQMRSSDIVPADVSAR